MNLTENGNICFQFIVWRYVLFYGSDTVMFNVNPKCLCDIEYIQDS